jgi:hypothetical protein
MDPPFSGSGEVRAAAIEQNFEYSGILVYTLEKGTGSVAIPFSFMQISRQANISQKSQLRLDTNPQTWLKPYTVQVNV